VKIAPMTEIAVTGMGLVTPAGCTLAAFWDQVRAGRSKATFLPDLDLTDHKVRFGCPVDGFELGTHLSAKEGRRMDRFARYGVSAALAAVEDAGSPDVDPSRAAIVAGNAVGGRETSDAETRNHIESGPAKVHPLMATMMIPNATAALAAIRLGWRGPSLSIATACASGAHAIGEALHVLRAGRADIVLAGGSEASLTPLSLAAFANLNALSTRNEDPQAASRPFDADRDGFVMGDGAGFVVLERLTDARARGARVHAVLAGYGATTDAHHLVMPPEDGLGAVDSMSAALADAGLEPGDVAHINAHGTSTPANDRAEALAIRKVFGPDAPPVTSTKGVIGHLIGAAGSVELIAAILAMQQETVPPTANHERLDPEIDLDVVGGAPRAIGRGAVLSNSFGFGGHNATLVVVPA
jgi:3-oxoacyl-[acyl-carrier-protein] synthase II